MFGKITYIALHKTSDWALDRGICGRRKVFVIHVGLSTDDALYNCALGKIIQTIGKRFRSKSKAEGYAYASVVKPHVQYRFSYSFLNVHTVMVKNAGGALAALKPPHRQKRPPILPGGRFLFWSETPRFHGPSGCSYAINADSRRFPMS